jgi:hypothetical protein
MSTAVKDWVVSRGWLMPVIAVAIVLGGLTAVPLSWATDKLAAPGTVKGQETKITVRPDGEAGEYRHQSFDILDNGAVSCGRLEFTGAIFAPVVGHVTFRTVEFDSCVYLGSPARLNTSSCEVIITSGGLGTLTSREGGICNLRVEAPGCTVSLGKGPFLELGYHNFGSPSETTALTEPVGIGGTAAGAGCLSPGPSAIAEYKGYLRLGGSRNGVKKPFIVIL